jgi:nitroimidazol reductase NimA-like FMN-containing flavoprotein (pyridoxamine 5'-phosphate oxidase superfamily)
MSLVEEILNSNLYCTLATVCEDGSPWATPVFFAYSGDKIYWWSSKNAVHSKNIIRDGRVLIVMYDSHAKEGTGKGIYLKAKAKMLENIDEVNEAISIYAAKAQVFKQTIEDSLNTAPTRFFVATISQKWTNIDGKENDMFVDLRELLA